MDQDRIEVSGRMVSLPNDRTVFLGRHPGFSNRCVIRFTNEENVLSFGLSDEALLALMALANSYSSTGEASSINFPAQDHIWTVDLDLEDETTAKESP